MEARCAALCSFIRQRVTTGSFPSPGYSVRQLSRHRAVRLTRHEAKPRTPTTRARWPGLTRSASQHPLRGVRDIAPRFGRKHIADMVSNFGTFAKHLDRGVAVLIYRFARGPLHPVVVVQQNRCTFYLITVTFPTRSVSQTTGSRTTSGS